MVKVHHVYSLGRAQRQPLQGFGTLLRNEHMQVECYSAAPAECSAVQSLLNPKVEQKAAG